MAVLLSQSSVAPGAPILYYSFELPDVSTDNLATDNSDHNRAGTLSTTGTGAFQYVAAAPAALAGTQSLALTEAGNNNAARLTRDLSTAELDLSNQSWTISTWFNRATNTSEDFIVHLGSGDGFGGGYEFYLYGPANSNNLVLHDYSNSAQDINLTVSGGAAAGVWHHAAIVHDAGLGLMQLYLDGTLAGSDSTFNLGLSQGSPTLVFGGHDAPTFQASRWLNGNLDDVAVFNWALGGTAIAQLAAGASPLLIPEPSTTAMLLGLGGIGLIGWLRRRRRG